MQQCVCSVDLSSRHCVIVCASCFGGCGGDIDVFRAAFCSIVETLQIWGSIVAFASTASLILCQYNIAAASHCRSCFEQPAPSWWETTFPSLLNRLTPSLRALQAFHRAILIKTISAFLLLLQEGSSAVKPHIPFPLTFSTPRLFRPTPPRLCLCLQKSGLSCCSGDCAVTLLTFFFPPIPPEPCLREQPLFGILGVIIWHPSIAIPHSPAIQLTVCPQRIIATRKTQAACLLMSWLCRKMAQPSWTRVASMGFRALQAFHSAR